MHFVSFKCGPYSATTVVSHMSYVSPKSVKTSIGSLGNIFNC